MNHQPAPATMVAGAGRPLMTTNEGALVVSETPTTGAGSRIIWTREDGCKCGAELAGLGLPGTDPNTANGKGRVRLLRVVEPACPIHGTAARRIEAAVQAVLSIARSTPGFEGVNEAALRRIFRAVYPILTGDTTANVPPVTGPTEPTEPGSEPTSTTPTR